MQVHRRLHIASSHGDLGIGLRKDAPALSHGAGGALLLEPVHPLLRAREVTDLHATEHHEQLLLHRILVGVDLH